VILKYILFLFLLISCVSPGGSDYIKLPEDQYPDLKPIDISFSKISNDTVLLSNGLWWGENKSKLVTTDTKVITYTINDNLSAPYNIQLFEQDKLSGLWASGISIICSRPPDLLVDSSKTVHIICFEPFASNIYDGKYVHYKMLNQNTVSGLYSKSDAGSFSAYDVQLSNPSNYASIYGSAAIDSDDNIYIVYNSSTSKFNYGSVCSSGSSDATGPHSITMRVYDGSTWTTEVIETDFASEVSYPKVVVTDGYIHIASIENEFKSLLSENSELSLTTGQTYCSHPFVSGIVHHIYRAKESYEWNKSEVVNLYVSRTLEEVYDLQLILKDIVVNEQKIYLLLEKTDEKRPLLGLFKKSFYYLSSTEGSSSWSQMEHIQGSDLSSYGYHIFSAKFFIGKDNYPYIFFYGVDIDRSISSDIKKIFGVKNIASQKYVVLDTQEDNFFELYTTTNQSGGQNSNDDFQYFLVAPKNNLGTILFPRLLQLEY
jgi:hypothetical protein